MAKKNNQNHKVIKTMVDYIKKRFTPKKIILYGSYAYGSPKSTSDIDLLVIMETTLPVKEQAFLIRRELRSKIPVDIIVRTPNQVKERLALNDFFIKQIVKKGKSL